MEQPESIKTYKDFEQEFEKELTQQAESFVRVGYLLKIARDTDILAESGFKSVAEFAQNKYGLTKDVVSRYIRVNDKFSENGYSDHLAVKFKGFEYSKLAVMLNLPDDIVDALSPQMTRKQIEQVHKEVKEEQQITPLEVAMEEKNPEQQNLRTDLQLFLHQYGYENREKVQALVNATDGANYIESILDILAPSGVNMLNVRISGRGRLMLSIRGKDNNLELVDVRGDSKTEWNWENLKKDIQMVYRDGSPETWEEIYGELFKDKQEKKIEESKEKEPGKQQSIKQPEQESGMQLSLKLPLEECKDMLFSKWFEFVAEEKIETACERLVHMRFTEFINTSPQKLGLLVQTSELTTEETKLDGETVVSVSDGTNHVYFTLPDFQARFRKAFLEPYKTMSAAEEKKPEVAPVQPDSAEEDEQIPGQKTVEDYPEMKPEKKLLESDYVTIAVRCMPGDTVYFLLDQEVMEATVTKLTIGPNKIPMIEAKAGDPNIFMEFNQAEDWNVTIFKSREAAEKALVKEE